jgi:hypothetical protein
MINFNQYVARRFLAGSVSLALDELEDGNAVHYSNIKRLLGDRYAEYDRQAKADLSIPVSEAAEDWAKRRDDLMRNIGFAINRKQLTDGQQRSEKEKQHRRQFNIEAEALQESYREIIAGTTDEAGFINYEDWFETPIDEPHRAAQAVIEEFPLPRRKKPGEYGEEPHRREAQRHYLQELLDALEGKEPELPEPAPKRSFLLGLLEKHRNDPFHQY